MGVDGSCTIGDSPVEGRWRGYDLVSYKEFMSSINPYEGKDVIVKIFTEKQTRKVQKRLFKRGYRWNTGKKDVTLSLDSLCFDGKTLYLCPELHNYDTYIVLSYDQFMNNELPLSDHVGKLDAYISGSSYLCYWDGEKVESIPSMLEAYQYNLLSEEEFKKKHPEKEEKLMYGEHEVEVHALQIKVGCAIFNTKDLRGYLNTANKFKEHGVAPRNAHEFLKENKEKLGL